MCGGALSTVGDGAPSTICGRALSTVCDRALSTVCDRALSAVCDGALKEAAIEISNAVEKSRSSSAEGVVNQSGFSLGLM